MLQVLQNKHIHLKPDEPTLKPHAQAHLLHPTDKCKICYEPAARHVHYGAMTCFSCRAFFRRSLQSNTSAKYRCMRQSMCMINIKTRKSCQYCRYMKCLAVGMNPNYVLSEDERRRRFKKRNNSLYEKKKTNGVPVIISLTVKKLVGNDEPKNTPYNEEKSQIKDFKEILEKQNEKYCASQMISSTDKEMKHCKKSSMKNEINVTPRITAYTPALQVITNETRGSIIIENSTTHHITKDAEYKKSMRNEENALKNEEQNIYYNKPLFQRPTFSELYENKHSKVIKENYSCYKQMLQKEIKEVQESDVESSSQSEDELTQKLMLSHKPEIIFTVDEKYQLDKLVLEHDTVYYSVNFGEVLIKEMLMCSMFGVAMSTSAAIQGYWLQVERITMIANSLKCFSNLRKADQVILLKENADLLVSLRGAIFFDTKKKGVDQIMSSMGIEDMETIKKMFRPLIQSHTMNHIDYKVFNSIQDPAAKKTEEQYSFLQGKVADSILDNITTILMTYVILFSSDFCSLEDKREVEQTQHHYLQILERFLYGSSSRAKACSRLAHMLNAVTCVREMADIKKCRSITHSAAAQYQAS